MKFFKSLGILSIILFLACSGVSGEERVIAPLQSQKRLKKQDNDSIQLFYNGSHRVKRGQKAIKRS